MNRIYKTVWNEQSRTFVAVSENTKARGKRSGQSTGRLAIASIVLAGIGLAGFSVTSTAADDAITFNADTGSTDVSLGQAVTISGTLHNVVTAVTGNTVQIALAPDIDLGSAGSLKIGNSMLNNSGLTVGSSALTSTGLAITGGPSVTTSGINAGTKVISNVATGVNGTDAVNVNQLADVKTTANKGWNVTANGTGSTQVKPGDTVDIAGDGNVVVSKTNANLKVNLAKNIDLGGTGSVKMGNTTVNNSGLTIASGPSVVAGGVNAGGKKITNVAAGDVSSSSSTDAVNGGQLYTLTNDLYTQGTGIKYFHANSQRADSQANGDESVAIGPKTVADGDSSLAAGNGASTSEKAIGAIALGQNATAGDSNYGAARLQLAMAVQLPVTALSRLAGRRKHRRRRPRLWGRVPLHPERDLSQWVERPLLVAKVLLPVWAPQRTRQIPLLWVPGQAKAQL